MVEALPTDSRPKTIKDHVLEAAQQAYPNPIRASALRRLLEEKGIKVHEKTIGMTLYRLSQRGLLTRMGWDWTFVPEDQRRAVAAESEGEESPGNDPGLLLEAAE